MRARLLGLAAVVALVFAVLTRGAGGPPVAEKPSPARRSVETPTSAPDPDPLPAPPERDIFRYAEAPAAAPSRPIAARPPAASRVPPPSHSPQPAALPLRLVGLVRRSEGLRAAVATSSGVVLVGPGDALSGCTILEVDEERGLRFRGPDGAEHLLSPRS